MADRTHLDEGEARGLLELIAEPNAWRVLRALLDADGHVTVEDLARTTRMSRTALSRLFTALRREGLVRTTRGRPERHEVCERELLVGLLLAADRLADRLLERRVEAQRRQARKTVRAGLKVLSAPEASTEGDITQHQSGD